MQNLEVGRAKHGFTTRIWEPMTRIGHETSANGCHPTSSVHVLHTPGRQGARTRIKP